MGMAHIQQDYIPEITVPSRIVRGDAEDFYQDAKALSVDSDYLNVCFSQVTTFDAVSMGALIHLRKNVIPPSTTIFVSGLSEALYEMLKFLRLDMLFVLIAPADVVQRNKQKSEQDARLWDF